MEMTLCLTRLMWEWKSVQFDGKWGKQWLCNATRGKSHWMYIWLCVERMGFQNLFGLEKIGFLNLFVSRYYCDPCGDGEHGSV